MHRATPQTTSLRSYSAGGARSLIDKVDDTKWMQEAGGNFLAGEKRDSIESPQNYGFTSVVFDAEKDAQGNIISSAETFMGFVGGNRSLPFAGAMDDRRHRLHHMEKGDTALYRGRGDKQQLHLTKDGGFWSAPQDKVLRLQLVSGSSGSNKGPPAPGSSAPQVEAFAGEAPSGQQASGQQQGQQEEPGQRPVYKSGQSSEQYLEITGGASDLAGKNSYVRGAGKKILVHAADDGKVYLGGKRGEGLFSKVLTEDGPSPFVLARVG